MELLTNPVFIIDWEETEEDTEDAHFWEDNWDDDDVEDDFSRQLRFVDSNSQIYMSIAAI
jgi:hypothetical protein